MKTTNTRALAGGNSISYLVSVRGSVKGIVWANKLEEAAARAVGATRVHACARSDCGANKEGVVLPVTVQRAGARSAYSKFTVTMEFVAETDGPIERVAHVHLTQRVEAETHGR